MNNILREQAEERLDEYLEAAIPPPSPAFSVTSDDLADWCIRKINRFQRRIDAVEQLAAERTRQTAGWAEKETLEYTDQMAFFLTVLRPYVEEQLAGGKSKTYKLPSGSVSMRSQAPEISIQGIKASADNLLLLEYVRKFSPDFLKSKETVDWAEFKKTLTVATSGMVVNADGEIIAALRGELQPDKLVVKEGKS